jgi:drug/metabolite transporter (DMT)-like permease
MLKLVVILLVALVLEAIGVVFLSHGLKQLGEMQHWSVSEVARLVGRGITNANILAGVALETIFFGALLFLLKNADVSLIWPLTALGFVLTTLAAKYLRHEEVSALRWAGVFLIMAGAALVAYSEKAKGMPPAHIKPTASISTGTE